MKLHYHFPFRLMITIIILVFSSEVLIMVALPLFPSLPTPIDALLDSLLLTIFLCPLLYLFFFRPLTRKMRQLAKIERSLRKKDGSVNYFVGMVEDITERKQAEAALIESEARLRDLAARMAKVTEEERKGLARELHDRIGQNLTALSINLNIIKEQLPAESTANLETRLSDAMDLVEETAGRIRDVMTELRPEVLDDYGLLAALRWYGERFSRRTGLTVRVAEEKSSRRLPPDTETTLFRIAQEAMVNVVKHAHADRISICLKSSADPVRLIIADNGSGFDPAASKRPKDRRGWGLISMQERAQSIAGHLRIESIPGKGTKVIVEVGK